LLPQPLGHWGKFLAAASRRSLGRVSVPVCLVVLSDQGPVIGLVRRYHTNDLMGRRPVPERVTAFICKQIVCGIATAFAAISPTPGLVPTWSSAVRHAAEQAPRVRLACIRHVASVRPEPGSNSACGGWSRPSGQAIAPKCGPTYIITIQLFRCATRLKANKKPGGGLPLHPGDVSGCAGAVRFGALERASVVSVYLRRSETVNTLVV
jgi:hypothetical protein